MGQPKNSLRESKGQVYAPQGFKLDRAETRAGNAVPVRSLRIADAIKMTSKSPAVFCTFWIGTNQLAASAELCCCMIAHGPALFDYAYYAASLSLAEPTS